jgi:acetamidase/formamidase
MDNKVLVAGSTLYLPIHVDGALFSVGDGHGVQGDGEVCITAAPSWLNPRFIRLLSAMGVEGTHISFLEFPQLRHPRLKFMNSRLAVATADDRTRFESVPDHARGLRLDGNGGALFGSR